MDRTTLLTTGIATALGLGFILPQISANKALKETIKTESTAVAQLEQQARSPGRNPAAVSALVFDQDRSTKTPEQRVEHARTRIDELLEGLNIDGSTPGELYKVMPDLMRLFSNLDVEEMLAVADGIDAPLSMRSPKLSGSVKLILVMLAAELDPARVLALPEVNGDPEALATVLSTLSRTDPDGARAWVAASDMTPAQQTRFENSLIGRALREDFANGITRIDEMGEKMALFYLRMIAEFGITKDQVPAVVDALDDIEHQEQRSQLVSIVMRDAMTEGGVAAARERSKELGFSGQDLSSFLRRTLWTRMETEPLETIAWAKGSLHAREFGEALPNMITNWARKDFNSAGQWLGELEPSPSRDAALASYAQTVISVDPEAAATWALEIADNKKREWALYELGAQWKRRDQTAAEAWFSAQGIPLR